AYDDQGRMLFSLQNDLVGSVLGTVEDGDVLRYANGVVTRVLSEADVQAKFTQATGLTSAILDVLSLEFVNGEVWVTTQSPSAFDGAVLSCGATPAIVIDEAAMGLGGAEIDALALARPGDETSGFVLDATDLPAGGTLHADFVGRPNSLQLVLP